MSEELTFAEKIKTLHFGVGAARQKMTREFRNPETGERIKQTKDEATTKGNIITEHAKGDRQDVLIRPDILRQSVTPDDHKEAKQAAMEIKESGAQ